MLPSRVAHGYVSAMLRQFFAYYRPHRRLFAVDFGCAVFSGLLELGFPMAIRAFIDQLLPGRDWGMILLASAALLGCISPTPG